jgi:anti-sigma B factor antagonist
MPEPLAPSQPTPATLTLDVERQGATATIHCHGRLVSGVGQILYNQVCQLLPQTKHLILDLGDLAHMDSMGLGTLVRIYVSTRSAGCTLELTHLGKRIRELLGVSGLLSVFRIVGENGIPMKF